MSDYSGNVRLDAARVVTMPFPTADALIDVCLTSLHRSIPTPEDWHYSGSIPFSTTRRQVSFGSTAHIFVATPPDHKIPFSDKPVGLILCTVVLTLLDQDTTHLQLRLHYANATNTPEGFRDKLAEILINTYDALKAGKNWSPFVEPGQNPTHRQSSRQPRWDEDKRAIADLRANPEQKDNIRKRWERAVNRNADRQLSSRESIGATWRRLVKEAKKPSA